MLVGLLSRLILLDELAPKLGVASVGRMFSGGFTKRNIGAAQGAVLVVTPPFIGEVVEPMAKLGGNSSLISPGGEQKYPAYNKHDR